MQRQSSRLMFSPLSVEWNPAPHTRITDTQCGPGWSPGCRDVWGHYQLPPNPRESSSTAGVSVPESACAEVSSTSCVYIISCFIICICNVCITCHISLLSHTFSHSLPCCGESLMLFPNTWWAIHHLCENSSPLGGVMNLMNRLCFSSCWREQIVPGNQWKLNWVTENWGPNSHIMPLFDVFSKPDFIPD